MTLQTNAALAMPEPDAPPVDPTSGVEAGAATPAIIVLGKDDASKPHASWFAAEQRTTATEAARLMGMIVVPVEGVALPALAARLPQGRVFASGRAFVPFVKASLYEELLALAPAEARRTALTLVRGAKTAAAKGKVVAAESGSSFANAAPAGEGGAGGTKAEGSSPAGSDASGNTPTLPKGWDKIVVGSLVLATEGPQEGWFEALVIEARGGDLFVLRWRDWPDEPTLVRHREHVGLLHPNFVGA